MAIDFLGIATSTADGFYLLLIALVVIFFFGFIGWFVWFRMQFKNFITIRLKTKGNTDLMYFDKYRYLKRKGEGEKIQVWRGRKLFPTPPEEAKDFTTKGREYIEAYLQESGELIFINTDNKPQNIGKKEVIDLDDKEFYANAFFEAQRFKGKGVLQWISENAGLLVIMFFLIIVVVFWGDITKPMIEIGEQNMNIARQNAELIETLQEMIQNKQIFLKETVGETNPPPD